MMFFKKSNVCDDLNVQMEALRNRVFELEQIVKVYERITPLEAIAMPYGIRRKSIPVNTAIYALMDYLGVCMRNVPASPEIVKIEKSSGDHLHTPA